MTRALDQPQIHCHLLRLDYHFNGRRNTQVNLYSRVTGDEPAADLGQQILSNGRTRRQPDDSGENLRSLIEIKVLSLLQQRMSLRT